jgi:FemAB-related protein (PEP-CTERM system-associated)
LIVGDPARVRVDLWTSADDGWRKVVDRAEHATLAHSDRWFETFRRAYGHTPLYLRAEDAEGQTAVLPAYVVRRPLGRPVVTSMPFLDAGGPCGSKDLAGSLVGRLVVEAARVGAARVELRCPQPFALDVVPSTQKVNLVLPLPGDPDRLWRGLDAKVRNQVRKAERSGLALEFGGPDHLDSFYSCFAANMRDLGSPVHSRGFFDAIFGSFGTDARTVLVRHGPTVVGGLVALSFKDRLVVPWASALRQYQALCPNMLMYWGVLRRGCEEGFACFEFGRSTRGSGTYNFKRQWGAIEESLFWYTIALRGRASALSGDERRREKFARLWRRLPLRVSRWVGPGLRRYLTQ